MKKIKEEQLETIRTQQKDLSTILTNIGILESQKHSSLHQLAELNKTIEESKVELQKEYGDVNINLEDGSYSEEEKEEVKEVEFEEVN